MRVIPTYYRVQIIHQRTIRFAINLHRLLINNSKAIAGYVTNSHTNSNNKNKNFQTPHHLQQQELSKIVFINEDLNKSENTKIYPNRFSEEGEEWKQVTHKKQRPRRYNYW